MKFPPEWFIVIDEGFEEVNRHRKDDGRILLRRNRVHSLSIKNTDDVSHIITQKNLCKKSGPLLPFFLRTTQFQNYSSEKN